MGYIILTLGIPQIQHKLIKKKLKFNPTCVSKFQPPVRALRSNDKFTKKLFTDVN